MKLRYLVIVILLLALLSWLAYFLGKQQGNVQVINIATNELLIKEIAELAALEVQGNAQITESNMDNSDGFLQSIRKAFIEQTINISIPYVAKYGVQADSNSMAIVVKEDQTILIRLPEAKLLSYEMRLDKATQSSTQGWLKNESYNSYNAVQQKLYKQSRAEAAASIKNKEVAQEKIIGILKNYYKPLGYKVSVQFGENESRELFPVLESPGLRSDE